MMIWWSDGSAERERKVNFLRNSINLSAGAIQIDRADEMNDDTLNRLGGMCV